MARWNAWRELYALQKEMTELVNQVWSGGVSSDGRQPAAQLLVDIRQTDAEFIIDASVPGFAPEEIEVLLDQGVLTIRGEHKTVRNEEGQYLRRERRALSFVRQVTMPPDIGEDGIRASFELGVLSVHVPRVQAPPPQRIRVEAPSPKQEVLETTAHQVSASAAPHSNQDS